MEKKSPSISYSEFQNLLIAICDGIDNNIDLLNELDSEIGDGDLGSTLHRGFKAIRQTCQQKYKTIGQLLVFAGMDFSNAACSTMGVLFGMAVLSAGVCVIENEFLDLTSVKKMLACSINSIKEKGGADLGDKTMLDIIIPISASLQHSLEMGFGGLVALESVFNESNLACEKTKHLMARKGRASWLGEQTIGHLDPGAVFISLIMKSIYEYFINDEK